MAVLSLIGFGAFVGVSLWVGARLLLLARRTREVPELAIGAALFLGGAGYCVSMAAFRLHLVPAPLLRAAFAVAMAALAVGVIALAVGVWKLFRPGERWALAAVAATALVQTASWAAGVFDFRPDGSRSAFVFWSFNATGAAAYAWSAFECFRYNAVLRRRARIGLVDPELAHRFRLWAIAGGAGAAVFLVGMIARPFVTGPQPAVLFAQSMCGFIAGVAIWLAFFPPVAYVRRIAGEGAR